MVVGDGKDEELIWFATAAAVKEILHLETEIEGAKLEKRIRDYFRKAAKGIEFGKKSWQQLVNDYADAVFANMFNALGEKEWLVQADFLLVLDAGIKDNFPAKVLANIPQLAFEKTVLAAYDRAFDEQRVLPIMWETVRAVLEGVASRKKVYNAAEFGRKLAAVPNPNAENEAEDYVSRWIDSTIHHLSQHTQNDPQWMLPEETALILFNSLIEQGALPAVLQQEHGPPPADWPVVEQSIAKSYVQHTRVVGEGKGGGKSETNAKKGRPKTDENAEDYDPEALPEEVDEAGDVEEEENGEPAAKRSKA